MKPADDIAFEQHYLDHAYRCLAAMRERTDRAVSVADNAAQAVDAAIARAHLEWRLDSLEVDVPGLAFGRLDEESGPTWYVGRRHVEDDVGDPVVIDWRAPIAVPFYRATVADPLGLRRRRRFLMSGRQVDDVFDEVFDDPDSVHAARHGGIPDPLLAELERARTGEMRDIVATIAAEQDVVIRASFDTCLVVQGGPGTGKTAVGLHRAAFLLYEHRELLDRTAVLVVGPNPVFLRYISQVLPSLGETAVRQTTIERLVAGTAYRVAGFDPDEVAALKGDARMAEVVAAAVGAAVVPPGPEHGGELVGSTPWGRVRVGVDALVEAVAEVQGRDVAHNVGRAAFRTQVARLAWRDVLARRGDGIDPSEVGAALRGDRGWQRALDRIWPALSAPMLVRKLLTSRSALAAAAAEGILEPGEQRRLLRKPARRLADEQWTTADLVLIAEAEALVTGAPTAYGHVVVDEAQDLSAMALRALARRCPSRSMTVLGDLAQATTPTAQHSWDSVLAALGEPVNGSYVELDLGYRVPAPIVEYANRLLPSAAPGVRPTRSVREAGRPPQLVPVDGDGVVEAVAEVVADQAAAWTSVGVIAVAQLHEELGPLLASHGEAVTLLVPEEAKGLEFDAVVVVEPSSIAGTTAAGGRLLYVALTRAVQELTIVHADPLPAPLSANWRT